MYAGKTQAKLNEEKLRRKRDAAKVEIEKNAAIVPILSFRSKTFMATFSQVLMISQKDTKIRSAPTQNSETNSVICANNSTSILCLVHILSFS